MEGKTLRPRTMVTALVLLFGFVGSAAAQATPQTSTPAEATLFDYTRNHAFPNILSPYITTNFVPRAR